MLDFLKALAPYAPQILALLIGFITPVAVEIAKQPRFKGTKVNLFLAVVTCVGIGLVTALVNGALVTDVAQTPSLVISEISIVLGAAFTAYAAYWKDASLPWLDKLSSLGLKPVDAGE